MVILILGGRNCIIVMKIMSRIKKSPFYLGEIRPFTHAIIMCIDGPFLKRKPPAAYLHQKKRRMEQCLLVH